MKCSRMTMLQILINNLGSCSSGYRNRGSSEGSSAIMFYRSSNTQTSILIAFSSKNIGAGKFDPEPATW
jgi:hypothetical protein